MKHRVAIAILILPATAAGMRWWFLHRSAAPTSWQGYVEADDIKVLPTQQGRLSAVPVGHRDTGAECPLSIYCAANRRGDDDVRSGQ